jgi:hypothetical protein
MLIGSELLHLLYFSFRGEAGEALLIGSKMYYKRSSANAYSCIQPQLCSSISMNYNRHSGPRILQEYTV